ncbi:tetratricopeptide repeat protein [Lysobacter arvi]|uniref:Tetratricopeptide repeat protein n=1 Tax=Lysobacter arvi TaxID=3038776 RepID=A0ABU1C8N2_9GAMM|nr:tetratricopeptide repeat protein [Lysobacter arvi]MDR0181548.1 tetratricopeptide repeat protein [Lysobacter arvi]
MTTSALDDEFQALEARAYDTFDTGRLTHAAALFGDALARKPDAIHLHYMKGLAHKYLGEWSQSLQHNLRAIALNGEFEQSMAWNAAIAATGLGDWDEARRQWERCGIRIPPGSGPIEGDFGLASIRLNPWHGGETVWARRIDPVRARLLNVPLPESGHRLFDIVLHDGAPTGRRRTGDGDRTAPVFNVLDTLAESDFDTYVAFVRCDSPEDLDDLTDATLPGIGYVEDWTRSVVHYCLRCSYGSPHAHHDAAPPDDWAIERNLGIGAQGKAAAVRLLTQWASRGPGRHVDGIETPRLERPARSQDRTWWRGEDEDDDEDDDSDGEPG